MFLSFESITVSNTVLTQSDLTIPANATGVVLQAGAHDVRYRMDDTDPSTSEGMLLRTTDPPQEFLVEDLLRIRFIRDGASDTTLQLHYFAGRDV